MYPPPVKIVNYVKLLEKTWSEDISADLSCTTTIECIIYKFDNYSKNKGEKYKIKQCSLEFISNDMRCIRKNQEKLWSEEIVTKIALELIHISIFLSMSF